VEAKKIKMHFLKERNPSYIQSSEHEKNSRQITIILE
jgi:hypothetical protein